MFLATCLTAALDTLTPLTCAGCGREGSSACTECAAGLLVPVRRVDHDARNLSLVNLPVWSAAAYEGEARSILLAWKRGREDVRGLMELAARELVDRWLADPLAPRPGPGTVVVPAPSGWQRRARGLLVVRDLAEHIRDGLAAAGVPDPVVADVLRRSMGPVHLAGLGAKARARARSQAVRMVGLCPGNTVLLVDDILTTGATLAASVQALRRGSGQLQILGALTLAATPPRSRR